MKHLRKFAAIGIAVAISFSLSSCSEMSTTEALENEMSGPEFLPSGPMEPKEFPAQLNGILYRYDENPSDFAVSDPDFPKPEVIKELVVVVKSPEDFDYTVRNLEKQVTKEQDNSGYYQYVFSWGN